MIPLLFQLALLIALEARLVAQVAQEDDLLCSLYWLHQKE
jgi:hypothetical protein